MILTNKQRKFLEHVRKLDDDIYCSFDNRYPAVTSDALKNGTYRHIDKVYLNNLVSSYKFWVNEVKGTKEAILNKYVL